MVQCSPSLIRDTGSSPPDFKKELLALVPFLRAFARSLCGHRDLADDLAQDTLVRAWQARGAFTPGTNMKAWLFTILRNQFYSDRRRAWRQMDWNQELAEMIPGSSSDQLRALELDDVSRAMRKLGAEQREALILVGAGGFSYEEAAAISACPIGTVKSRVARARAAILDMLEGPSEMPAVGTSGNGDPMARIMAQLDRLMAMPSPSPGPGEPRPSL